MKLSRRLSQHTDSKEWVNQTRAQSPILVRIGKKPPKLVLSFGGAGFLTTYSLGVAKYLQAEKQSLISKSFLLGAGSGVLPALALAYGPEHVNIDHAVEYICDNFFSVSNEKKRREVTAAGLEAFLPSLDNDKHKMEGTSSVTADPVKIINGRVALTVGFSNKDYGYLHQNRNNILYGHHIAQWDDREDLLKCIVSAMACNVNKPMQFRDADNVMRGTFYSMSSELDQSIRHVHIHGYCGDKYNRHSTRHNFYFGKHGFLSNTSPFLKQAVMAFRPNLMGKFAKSAHMRAYEAGYVDARRYERWEEDPYFYAKPDRKSNDMFSMKSMISSVLLRRKVENYEL
eukprot:Tbor_TRINITY_DN3847_c0_g1::TRINITY_DN3847_c0_g1_i3::g.5642::m.5642